MALSWWISSSSARAAFEPGSEREVRGDGAEQQRRAGRASQFLEHQDNFAQSGLSRVDAQGGEALTSELSP